MKKSKLFSPTKIQGAKKFAKKRHYETMEWTEYRNLFLHHNPTCYACGARARVVDHIVAHKGDEGKFWSENNFIPLCKHCHDTVTGLFDQFVVPKTEEKMKWLANMRLKNEVYTKVKVVPVKKFN